MRCLTFFKNKNLFIFIFKGKKRVLSGPLREAIGRQIATKSSEGWRRHFARKYMNFGDSEPYNLYSNEVLRKAKEEQVRKDVMRSVNVELSSDIIKNLMQLKHKSHLTDFIKHISIEKFTLHYWSPEQTLIYKEESRKFKNDLIVSIDATGSLIKKMLSVNENMSHIFMYGVILNNSQMPVSQMVSASHNSNCISFWLKEWLREVGHIPSTVVCDHSFALMHAICQAFNGVHLNFYINKSFNKAQKNKTTYFPCFLRIDYNHFVHLVSCWKCFKGARRQLKDFYVRSMNLLIECRNFKQLTEILKNILLISVSEYENQRVRDAKSFLKNKFGTTDDISDDISDEFESFQDDEVDHADEKNYAQAWFDDIKVTCDKIKCSGGEFENFHYLPEILSPLRMCFRTLPLWSGIMTPVYGFGKATASSAQVESFFKDLKKITFENFRLPINIDKYLITVYNDIKAKAILLKAHQKIPEEKLKGSPEENWKGKNIKKKSYYRGPQLRETKIFHLQNGSITAEFIDSFCKRCIFKNTCALDSLLQIISTAASDSIVIQNIFASETSKFKSEFHSMILAIVNREEGKNIYRHRAALIKSLDYCKHYTLGNTEIYQCECNVCNIIEYGIDYCVEVYERCSCGEKKFFSKFVNININIIKEKGFEYLKDSIQSNYKKKCFDCNQEVLIKMNFEKIIFIDTNDCNQTNTQNLDSDLDIYGEVFQLRGAVCYIPSEAEIGHYFGISWRDMGYIESYDDMHRTTKVVKNLNIVPHILIFSK